MPLSTIFQLYPGSQLIKKKKKYFYLIDVSRVLVIFPQFPGQNVNKNKTILYEIMRSSSVAS
jgi:hypothetical protein